MTIKSTLSDEETAQPDTHSCSPKGTKALCAFAGPEIQGMSKTVPLRQPGFLIANLELEFELNHRKQSPLEIPNSKYFAISSLALLHFSASTPPQPSNPNSNIGTIRIWLNPAISVLTQFLTATKIDLFAICLSPRFSPPKGISRDMIPALK
jgi:hypothetical protein